MLSRIALSLLLVLGIGAPGSHGQDPKKPAAEQEAERLVQAAKKRAQEIEAEATKRAQDITTEAERRAAQVLAEAKTEAARMRGEAEAAVARIQHDAYQKNPELYLFTKKLEALKTVLASEKITLVITRDSALFKVLFDPPPPAEKSPEKDKGDGKQPKQEQSKLQQEVLKLIRDMKVDGRIVVADEAQLKDLREKKRLLLDTDVFPAEAPKGPREPREP